MTAASKLLKKGLCDDGLLPPPAPKARGKLGCYTEICVFPERDGLASKTTASDGWKGVPSRGRPQCAEGLNAGARARNPPTGSVTCPNQSSKTKPNGDAAGNCSFPFHLMGPMMTRVSRLSHQNVSASSIGVRPPLRFLSSPVHCTSIFSCSLSILEHHRYVRFHDELSSRCFPCDEHLQCLLVLNFRGAGNAAKCWYLPLARKDRTRDLGLGHLHSIFFDKIREKKRE